MPITLPAEPPAEPAEPAQDPEEPASWQDPSPEARGWLGVELAVAGESQPGVLVRSVIPGSPAEQAGVLPGDIILSIDGQPVQAPGAVVENVGRRAAGERVAVALRRASRDRLLAVILAPRPDEDEVQRMRYVGAPAPRFESLKPVQGSVSPSLSALRGKVVVLHFWSPWCVVCRLLVPTLNKWHARYSAQGLEVIGITTESVVRAAQAAAQLGISHPVLSDETGKTTRGYRAFALPAIFIIDRRGTVRDVLVGYSADRLHELPVLLDRLVAEP
jgi:peroxiredoxin